MKFGKLELNPAFNPGVLDTGTWDGVAAAAQVRAAGCDWTAIAAAARLLRGWPATGPLQWWPGSAAVTPQGVWVLADLPDGQSVLIGIGSERSDRGPGGPLAQWSAGPDCVIQVLPTSAAVLDVYCRLFKPAKGPQALGDEPRLGIGTRMTTQVWPGIFEAMAREKMAANSIQNSIRELSLLEDLLAALPPETNYSTGIGTIEVGWTGSTYEGLWVAGVLAALRCDHELLYGADADHVQVKRGPGGVERARRVLRAARYYSFYTLDMADVLDYAALATASGVPVRRLIEGKIPEADERRLVLEYLLRPQFVGLKRYQLDVDTAGRLIGKYWDALASVEVLAAEISHLKSGVPFDLELTIDEHPPEVAAFDCLTTDAEVLFLALEIKRRRLPITHLAPNFGQEKGYDYRCPDGLAGLEQRARAQFEIAAEFGLMLDVHSGDDLSSDTRQVFGRAASGRLHFKVSPMLQVIYAETLQQHHPDVFDRWWNDAWAYAQREAAAGSPAAEAALAELAAAPGASRSCRQKVFMSYSFPFVGRRDAHGQFLHREEFYRLSPPFLAAYQARVAEWLSEVAADVFHSTNHSHAIISR